MRLNTSDKTPRRPGIYVIRCVVTGKEYVGSAAILRKRLTAHRNLLTLGRHHSIHLQRAWDKHGAENFLFSVVLFCEKKDLLFYEQRAIDFMRPAFNVLTVAGSNAGKKTSDETREKISRLHKARFQDPEERAKAADRLAKLRADPEIEATRRARHAEAMKIKAAAGVTVPEDVREKIRRTKRATLERYLVKGELLCLPEIREKYGITVYTFRARLNRGWDIDRAATEEVRTQKGKDDESRTYST